ncbi:uncharacterized protein LOC119679377 [Teleopsis dalmanni]|uniref:uncharacterized protein LOC119679377 n=1 Tax=Teleopsis dalmanni TaxID=139649 RepID=UPI0018CE1DAE|nr:uncharacterized protein LOC119679377 [Teleopsis dalmanni]XP_037947625.1 uncharacterized protein LOC119679377 [Teleopsis dalmanni]XP_037947626.1 uncharacterized protein LOC119679377 [Teleopsis dalmanni]
MGLFTHTKFWIEFIDLYQSLPALWKVRHSDYNNKRRRIECLAVLVKKLREIQPNANVRLVKSRINNLRTGYRREIKKIEASEKSGDDLYVPTVWYFNHLNFLKGQVEKASSIHFKLNGSSKKKKSTKQKVLSTFIDTKFWKEFINLYQSLPALWKVDDKEYHNRKRKDECLAILVKKLREFHPDADVQEVKRSINTLRSGYRREIKKVKASEKSGATGDDLYVSKFWYFNSLNFLRAIPEKDPPIDYALNDSFKQTQSNGHLRKKNEERNEIIPEAISPLPSSKKIKLDEANALSTSWEVQYRNLERNQQIYANKMINEVLYQATLGNLNEYSYKVIEHQQPGVRTISSVGPNIRSFTVSTNTIPKYELESEVDEHSIDPILSTSPYNKHESTFKTVKRQQTRIRTISSGNSSMSNYSATVSPEVINVNSTRYAASPSPESFSPQLDVLQPDVACNNLKYDSISLDD